jgi:hypothetical protein
MRPGQYWIFFSPCRTTCTKWPKLETTRLASTAISRSRYSVQVKALVAVLRQRYRCGR